MTEQLAGLQDENLAGDVEALTSVFNLADVTTEITPGRGWQCAQDPDRGIVVSIDPLQLGDESGHTDPTHVLFAGRHELQHARDMLDPEWSKQPDLATLSQKDLFFWNFVHDITIDGRTVKDYRDYRRAAPDIYDKLVRDSDVRGTPKHIQFMQGLRFQSVLNEDSPLRLDPDVQEAIDRMRNYEGHDLTGVLQHRGTTLGQRIALAEKFIKPEFDKFVSTDLEQQSDQELEQQAGDANHQGDMTDSGSGSQPENEQNTTFEEQLDEATRQYQEAQAADDGDEEEENTEGEAGEEGGSAGDDSEQDGQGMLSRLGHSLRESFGGKDQERQSEQPFGEESFEEQVGKLGGTIKSELGLSGPDAEAYARAMLIHRPLIHETADIFVKLARIDRTPARMIPNRQALPEGERLHTGRLPEAYIQGISNIPMDIWRGKERKAPKVLRQFDGLDVYLLNDASISMNGAPALHAAHMSMVLIEGLLLARHRQAREVQGKQPDVRIGSMLFAGDTKVVMPLSHDPSGQDRARTFINTKKANNQSTLVCPGLGIITDDALQNPERDVIGIVVSDNRFGDTAYPIVSAKPANCTFFNFILDGGSDSLGVGEYAAQVQETSQLPANLLRILRHYERQFE